ncbi:MAG: ABC transporter ATP-binding protein [Propionivibrio sp.]|nr:ABC transporter ATP-binding protein [Propionivibrio sp.]
MLPDDVAISVRNLSKTYRLFGHPGDRIKQFFSLGLKQYHREFTALKDISFEIKKGETVGIIGRNGSGKSTLLQLICGILKPTFGFGEVNGRVSALLELGAGFNPEFTGRENVYFQGALMGFTEAQMDKRFDEIATFADIGEFIDQPVRTYSSGMFVRLAFAVAIHIDADTLIIDEALAVGDLAFQAKCTAFLRRFREAGGTLLIVSHDLNIIRALCDTGICLMNGGCVVGPVDNIAGTFVRSMRVGMAHKDTGTGADSRPGTGEARIDAVELLDEAGNILAEADFNQPARLRLQIRFNATCAILASYYILDGNGLLLGTSTMLEGAGQLRGDPGVRLLVEFSTRLPLADGTYNLLAQLTTPIIQNASSQMVDYFENAACFAIRLHRPVKVWSRVYVANSVSVSPLVEQSKNA